MRPKSLSAAMIAVPAGFGEGLNAGGVGGGDEAVLGAAEFAGVG